MIGPWFTIEIDMPSILAHRYSKRNASKGVLSIPVALNVGRRPERIVVLPGR